MLADNLATVQKNMTEAMFEKSCGKCSWREQGLCNYAMWQEHFPKLFSRQATYRVSKCHPTPEKKKQVKSEVMSRMRETHKIACRTVDMLTNACFFHTLRKNETVSVKALNRYR